MSLQVWLPLNGNLDNIGLSGVTVANNGATVNNNGKIGKCYSFNNNSIYGSITGSSNWTKCSGACWVYYTDVSTPQYMMHIGGQDGWKCKAGIYIQSNVLRLIINGVESITTLTLAANKWNHVVFTWNGSVAKIYVNGVESFSTTTSGTFIASEHYAIGARTASTAGTTFAYPIVSNGALNDIRIYDHCLSPFEVSEISKGLVLHYKLDDAYIEETINIASSLTPQANINGWGRLTATRLNINNYHIKHYYGSSSNSSYWSTFVYTLPSEYANKTISFSAKLRNINYHDINDNTSWIFFGQGNNGTYPTHGTATYYIRQLYENMQLSWTGTLNNTNNYLVFEIWNNDLNTNGTVELDLYDIQIEEKDHITPYTNISRGFRYDTQIYIEPDGSKWARIVHHNNPANSKFSSSDDFANGVYKDADKWFDVYQVVKRLNTYEFMIKQKTTSSASETKYRWIQNYSPLTATYAQVAPTVVTRITTSGYTDGGFGGLYVLNTNTHMVIANNTNGNWYGAFGCWTAYNGGIPGYPNTTVSSGYMDLYVRVDSDELPYIYDSSGYVNNGTVVGTAMTMSSDSPRYSKSTFITDGVANYIKSPQIRISGDAMTISIWVKSTNTTPTGNYHMPFESATSGYVEMSIGTSGFLRGGLYVGGTRYVANTSGVNILDGNWHMISLTYDGANIKRYIDGVLLSTSAATGTLNATAQEYYIGKYGTSSSYGCSDMSLSDARIYATALSESDMKELHDSAAWIDNNGNVECFECVETTEDIDTEIMQNGDAKSTDLIEVYDYLYLPAGTYVTTGVSVAVGDATKTEVEIRYATGGSGRDLMGWSVSAANYFGVTAAGAWEKLVGTSSDITVRNLATYNYTAANAGTLQVGALTNGYSTRNKYIYHFKFYKGTTLVADLWPAYSSGRCGLVNLVDNEFYQASSDNAQVGNDNTKEAKIYSRCIESNEFLEV